eukprot:TRINITY_DN5527_c0_g2_i1.p1 TRINITY_DN5527_c0_g2~~TRINITY_DN5527_c0_g2_i1.p1  ORF type:complete len:570 (-),score=70.77 TRINITY_DN5527_c0_g2_i1:44-1753(-)
MSQIKANPLARSGLTQSAIAQTVPPADLNRSNSFSSMNSTAPNILAPTPTTTPPLSGSLSSSLPPETDFFNSVVKVYCMHTDPYYSLPWQMSHQQSSTSSGFVISGRRILTNAHSVEHYTLVRVRRVDRDTKFIAEVQAIGRDCDLAVLKVSDEAFWEDLQPIRLSQLPRLQETVTVVGYPLGGDNLSVTMGVVSRLDMHCYAHSNGSCELLVVQIDAAINPGNSGGPVFNSVQDCVGIAFQGLKTSVTENIGYIIPIPVVEHFLLDIERNGKYTGFCGAGFRAQKMENPQLRSFYGLSPTDSGILVQQIEPLSSAYQLLLKGDVILSFDGVRIANDATVPFNYTRTSPSTLGVGHRISWSYLISQKFPGEECALEVRRKGQDEILTINLRLSSADPLIPLEGRNLRYPHLDIRLPSYFIIAGLVFVPLTACYLISEYPFESSVVPSRLLDLLENGTKHVEGEEVVVLSQVLAHPANVGYDYLRNIQVHKLNGEKILNLKQLAGIVEDHLTKVSTAKIQNEEVEGNLLRYLRFDLGHGESLILNSFEVLEVSPAILSQHNIAFNKSSDL